ncbi:MAG TPA: alanine--tRNA ligase [Candidatus Gemmiger avicola]|uniref:Alanine--tRNA ligase n=1 Tax=Candidatus Gemmiger avicola TaxID=2838605 RepID=A0A9D2S316_9FIRM|nr:alanine--tRNA ligase [Candidatus Gemmiger avicola]
MQWRGLNELREKYLHFFETKDHLRLGSFPLVPKDDPSLLLINSGMAPMKKWFLGQEEPPRHRVTTCQKCIRTPDIERVGITARHGTFFEMLGNFSFQDYFKEEVIPWAWEFLTETLEIPAEKLYISVYLDDDEAYDIWTKKVGIPEDHMVRFGKEDNFWEHGSGPCGPCSEIYYDRGPEHGCGKPDCRVGCDCDRYMEIWNLVFSQYDSDGNGHYERLPKPNIDTGMGLERLACVMQDVGNLFEVDTVASVLHHVERISGKKYGANEKDDISIRVITDHIRSTVFMVSDGILPSNEGRGYVLRRLLRRAARHGRMLGIDHPFLTELVDTVIESSEAGYPELREHEAYIKKVVGTEEERFSRTIDAGISILNAMIDKVQTEQIKGEGKKVLSGADVFKLNDTFGFPLDLTREIAAEAGVEVDEEAFHAEMTKQRERARAERLAKDISGWAADLFGELEAEPTAFDGYTTLEETARVVAISDGEEMVEAVATDSADPREGVLVVLDRTPFYAEMGGQVADTGLLICDGAKLAVEMVKKTPKGYYVHTCKLLNGSLKVGDTVTASVDAGRRGAICRNHTATHLMQKALREVLGDHVHQAGSYQDDHITRFDFTHFSAVTPEELAKVERLVNEKIYASLPVVVNNLPIEEAKKMGAMALFGEKYGNVVRVVDAGGWSVEFCGGTHVQNTAQIGCFKILSESSVAAGIRRIEATTGFGVLALLDERNAELTRTAAALKANNIKDVPARAEVMAAELKELSKQLEAAKVELAANEVNRLFEKALDVDGVRVVTMYLKDTTPDTLRGMMDKLRDAAPDAVGALIGTSGEKTTLAVGVGKQALTKGLKAGVLVKQIAAVAGGNGGGKPDFAMAGIRNLDKVDAALRAVAAIVKSELEKNG